jgi:hypothetical protein
MTAPSGSSCVAKEWLLTISFYDTTVYGNVHSVVDGSKHGISLGAQVDPWREVFKLRMIRAVGERKEAEECAQRFED